MTQMTRTRNKPLEEGDSYIRLLVVIIPVFNIASAGCGFLAAAVADLPAIKPSVGTLHG